MRYLFNQLSVSSPQVAKVRRPGVVGPMDLGFQAYVGYDLARYKL